MDDSTATRASPVSFIRSHSRIRSLDGIAVPLKCETSSLDRPRELRSDRNAGPTARGAVAAAGAPLACCRRDFAKLCIGLVLSSGRPTAVLGEIPPRRTIFDEERELNQKLQMEASEERRKALRAAFDAVELASKQLEDVVDFVNKKDWSGIRRFARLFNDAVEREGMEPLARKLEIRKDREETLVICKQLTQILKDIDRDAKKEDGESVLANLQRARDALQKFQVYRP